MKYKLTGDEEEEEEDDDEGGGSDDDDAEGDDDVHHSGRVLPTSLGVESRIPSFLQNLPDSDIMARMAAGRGKKCNGALQTWVSGDVFILIKLVSDHQITVA